MLLESPLARSDQEPPVSGKHLACYSFILQESNIPKLYQVQNSLHLAII